MAEEELFELPPLTDEEQRLIDAYEKIGVPLDKLAYTPEFDRLIQMLGKPNTLDEKYLVFQRLLSLRKRSRLPRIYRVLQ
jgi:hypothetical protein